MVACPAPLSMEFSRQEYWNGLPFPFPGDLPDPAIEPRTPVLQTDTLLSEPPNLYLFLIMDLHGLPRWLSGKESTCNAEGAGLTSGLGRSPGKGNGNPFQYACLGNSINRGAWWATVHGLQKSWT